jgi:integrase
VSGQFGQLFKQPSGTWAFRYRDPHTGKRPQKSGFRTKGEAREALNTHVDRLRLGGHFRPKVTVGELVDEFFAIYHADQVTVDWMRYHAGKITDTFEDTLAAELDAAAIGRWRRALTNSGSAHQTLGVFRQILGAALKWGWIERNAATLVPNPQPRRAEVEHFDSWAMVGMVAAELGAKRDGGAIAIVGAGTGMRPEEMFALDWPDVDLERRVVTVRRVYTKGILKPYGKTEGSRRRIPLRGRVVDALEALPGPHRGHVFHGERGARIRLENWRDRNWDIAIEAAGMPGVGEEGHLTPYCLRHTYAAWSLAAGINIFTLARRMGTSVQMIEKTYGHLAHDADEYERTQLDAWDIVNGTPTTDGAEKFGPLGAFEQAWRA